jgi:hypothetical protein
MAKLSKDINAGNLHPRESLFITGNLGALNAEVIVDADGSSSVTLDLRGTFNLTVEVSGTIDGTNWTLIPLRPINTAAVQYVAAVAGSALGVWAGKCAPYRRVRARVTAYTSGTAIATLLTDTAPLDDSLQGMVTPQLTTAVGAAGAAVTLTIAAPGAGLRQYLTYLRIVRYATVVLTANATPVTITTTNIPGTLAFTFPADAAAVGTVFTYQEDFAYPLATSAQNTTVTIVCPVTTGVIWRVTAGHYVAP